MDLTPEELAFFETGDIAALKLETPAETPAPAEAPAEAPAPAEPPAATPAPVDPSENLQRILAQEEARRVQLEQSIVRLQKQIEDATKPAPEPEPDPVKDPLGVLMHKMQKIMSEVEALKTGMVQQTQEQQQATEFQSFVSRVQTAKAEFAKEQGDFDEAYKHLRQARADDLRDVGVPEAEIARALLQDELAVSQNAIAQGKNPAQVIYNMAKRYGYKQAPAPATAAAQIAAVAKGTQANTEPPAKSGSGGELTLDGLKDAGEADLDKLVQDEKLWGKLVGGGRSDIFDA